MSSSRGDQVANTPPPQPTVEELRAEYGTSDDDELILRALVPGEGLEKMRSSGAVAKSYSYLSDPQLEYAAKLMQIVKTPVFQLKTSGLELYMRKD